MSEPGKNPDLNAGNRPLAKFNGARPNTPAWYSELAYEPAETLRPTVDGAEIEVLVWGKRGMPGVLLAHGNRAHARWWGPVAPMLAENFRVVSLSFSGMGGSQWRSVYSVEMQLKELFAAAEAGGLFSSDMQPVFVGHSFGARAVTLAASQRGQELLGAILVDGAIRPEPLPKALERRSDPRYDSLADALARFNLRPPQTCENLFLLHDVAVEALRETAEGWRWCYDPAYYKKLVYTDVWPAVARPQCHLAFIFGENSAIAKIADFDSYRRQAPPGTPFVGIPQAGHHVMLDQPIAITTALRALVTAWHQVVDKGGMQGGAGG